jgi:hypothetical protein
VDLIALRIKTSKSGKVLVEAQQLKDGQERAMNRLPAVMRPAGGSGLERAKSEVKRLLAQELGTTTDVVKVEVKESEQHSYRQESKGYPALFSVYRKSVFNATVNMDASAAQLAQIGLPGEQPFTNTAGGITSTYKWYTPEEIAANNVRNDFPQKVVKEVEGFKPLAADIWTETILKQSLETHNIDTTKFGVGAARSLTQFVDEANSGETHLLSDGSGLRRHLKIIIIKIRNDMGAYMIETGHSFGMGQKSHKNAFPATKIRPFEDKVWAVRRFLSEVDVPYWSSKIIFGPERVEKQDSPSYPGVTTVYYKQVVEVQLMEIDVANLDTAEDANKWFSSKAPQIDLQIVSPRPMGREITDA